jgi:hypothetical protein
MAVVVSSAVLYVLAAVLGVKAGWAAAWPLLLVGGIADAACLLVWLTVKKEKR